MWKKRILCLVMAVCAAVLLTACQQEQTTYPNQPRQDAAQSQNVPAPDAGQSEPVADVSQSQSVFVDYDSGDYDPSQEEDSEPEEIIYSDPGQVPAMPTAFSQYAGATPAVIDPIDKPTPTPLPKLTFSYQTYESGVLHLSFEGPAGWIVDDSGSDTYILMNPDTSMDYTAEVMIRVVPVNKNYTRSELTKEVKGFIESLQSEEEYSSFEPSNTATRTFIDGTGVYMSYRGYLKDGPGVAGRVIINCVNKTLYILHASYPRGLADTFAEGVYNKVRHTMKLIK